MGEQKIRVETTVDATADEVWDCYTNPNHIIHWNCASREWTCHSVINDLRVGGLHSMRLEVKNGSFGFDFNAIYDAVDIGKCFAYTIADGRKVTATLSESENTTKITLIFDRDKDYSAEMQRKGWQAILDSFKNYAESQQNYRNRNLENNSHK